MGERREEEKQKGEKEGKEEKQETGRAERRNELRGVGRGGEEMKGEKRYHNRGC